MQNILHIIKIKQERRTENEQEKANKTTQKLLKFQSSTLQNGKW